jgi:transcriptional regulator CtsR
VKNTSDMIEKYLKELLAQAAEIEIDVQKLQNILALS